MVVILQFGNELKIGSSMARLSVRFSGNSSPKVHADHCSVERAQAIRQDVLLAALAAY